MKRRKKRLRSNRAIRDSLYDKGQRECAYCHRPLTREEATLDHVIPKSKGGKQIIGYDERGRRIPINVVLACSGCNQTKGDKAGIALAAAAQHDQSCYKTSAKTPE